MPSPNAFRRPDPALIAGLRASIRRLERHAPATGDGAAVLGLGAPEIDGALPWGGLPRAALHEIVGGEGTADGFCAALLARLAGNRAERKGWILWCRRRSGLYGPGLAAFGLDPGRLIVVRGHTANDILWAMEEGLHSGCLAAVLGEAGGVTPIAARRLQLAAESGGVTALLLSSDATGATAGPALTRWRISAAPSLPLAAADDVPRWQVELLRCRNGNPATWLVEWHHGTTGGFAVAADLRHRPAEPAAEGGAARRAG